MTRGNFLASVHFPPACPKPGVLHRGLSLQDLPHPPARRDPEGDHPARFGPGPLAALRGGGQAMIFIFSHPALLAPRLYKRHRHCGHRRDSPPSHHVPCPISTLRTWTGQVTWPEGGIRFRRCPQHRYFFLARGHWLTSMRFLMFCLATHPWRGCGPGTSSDTSTLPARPPPPASNVLRLPKKRE